MNKMIVAALIILAVEAVFFKTVSQAGKASINRAKHIADIYLEVSDYAVLCMKNKDGKNIKINI